MNAKNKFISLGLGLVLILSFVPSVKAQEATPAEINRQLIVALKQVIALLVQQVAELTRQLQEQQVNLGAITEQPLYVPVPTLPQNIASSTNKNVREGVAYPRVMLQAHALRREPERNPQNGTYFREEAISGNEVRNINSNRGDKLRILISVGNPDRNFTPIFTCSKFGDWSGLVAPYDQWDENVKVFKDSLFGVECVAKDGYTSSGILTAKLGDGWSN